MVKPGIPNEGGKDFSYELPAAEQQTAICIGVWDIGMHESTFQGETTIKRKLLFRWEVEELMPEGSGYEGKHKCINRYYNCTLHEKAPLRAAVVALRGKDFDDPEELAEFDTDEVIGCACLLDIEHKQGKNDRKYAQVKNVAKLPKKLEAFTPDNLYTDGTEPDWVQKIRDKAVEASPMPIPDYDLPFKD